MEFHTGSVSLLDGFIGWTQMGLYRMFYSIQYEHEVCLEMYILKSYESGYYEKDAIRNVRNYNIHIITPLFADLCYGSAEGPREVFKNSLCIS